MREETVPAVMLILERYFHEIFHGKIMPKYKVEFRHCCCTTCQRVHYYFVCVYRWPDDERAVGSSRGPESEEAAAPVCQDKDVTVHMEHSAATRGINPMEEDKDWTDRATKMYIIILHAFTELDVITERCDTIVLVLSHKSDKISRYYLTIVVPNSMTLQKPWIISVMERRAIFALIKEIHLSVCKDGV